MNLSNRTVLMVNIWKSWTWTHNNTHYRLMILRRPKHARNSQSKHKSRQQEWAVGTFLQLKQRSKIILFHRVIIRNKVILSIQIRSHLGFKNKLIRLPMSDCYLYDLVMQNILEGEGGAYLLWELLLKGLYLECLNFYNYVLESLHHMLL